ncbi:MAG: radical SAM protein [Syntrophorhabdaceae bacterium]|nr:radical SAM protein [Syntrophorhabdaceae bacterium]
MEFKIIESDAKNILNASKVYKYTINPYTGCTHGCHYCYARFIKRFLNINNDWGIFVRVKVNAPILLAQEIRRKKRGEVWISGVCDPYQPIEEKYELTKKCLEILIDNGWPVYIQTKSPLILRDLKLLKSSPYVDVYLTITTGDDKIRRLFEPDAPPIEDRINTLRLLHKENIRTHIMIAPLLIGAETLVEKTKDFIHSVLIDRMNYHYADWVYRKHKIEWANEESFFRHKGNEIKRLLDDKGIPCELLF